VRWQATEGSGGIPVWHVGYLVDGSEYLQVSQSAATEARFVPEQTAGGKPLGDVTIGDARWQRYEADKRRSLVGIEDGVTTVISGTLSWPEMQAAAESVGESR
jgi:hypothetical protein